MITGEERLRENLADLYGNVIFYDGRPSQTQVERTDVIARELADVVRDFDAWSAKELGGLNTALGTKQLEPVRVRSEEHTSELQSRLHLVCRLLLEKKKIDEVLA